MRAIFSAMLILLSLLASDLRAAVITVDVTIKAVDPQAKSVAILYKGKTSEFDVSRNAEIKVNGKTSNLDSIKPGQKATISYEAELSIVTKIEALSAPTGNQPELVEVPELNDEGLNLISWLSEDGLTIYWSRNIAQKWTIWTAHRDNPQSFFKNKEALFKGKYASLSSDGLEMVLLNDRTDGKKGSSFFVTTREALDKKFNRPKEIPELSKFYPGMPCLSSDSLTLYFISITSAGNRNSFSVVYSTRKKKSSPWSDPKPVAIMTTEDDIKYFNPFGTADGLYLFLEENRPTLAGEKGNMLLWSRSSVAKPFEKSRYIEFDNLPPLIGGEIRYVAATNELFFVRRFFEDKKPVPEKTGIWVVKNFKLPLDEK